MCNDYFCNSDMRQKPMGCSAKGRGEAYVRSVVCGCRVYAMTFVLSFLLSVLCGGCSSTQETSVIEQHKVENLFQRMDSVLHTKSIIQQDSAWRQEILRQFQSVRERNDTSHTVVVDTAGHIIKETLIIRTERESNSETEREERLVLLHRLEVMDSTLHSLQQQVSHSDSLLRQESKTIIKEVEKPLSLWQQARLWLANLILLLIALLLVIWLLRRRITPKFHETEK